MKYSPFFFIMSNCISSHSVRLFAVSSLLSCFVYAQSSSTEQDGIANEKVLTAHLSNINEQMSFELHSTEKSDDTNTVRELIEAQHQERKALLAQLREQRKVNRADKVDPEVIEVPLLPDSMKAEEAILIEIESTYPGVLYPHLEGDALSYEVAHWQAENTQRWKRFREARDQKRSQLGKEALYTGIPDSSQNSFLLEIHRLGVQGGAAAIQTAMANPKSNLSLLRQQQLQKLQIIKDQRSQQK